ncbi:DUF1761 domain-containing protein [Litorimonas sp.]|uniref:DUF1761 domain-containing protein n=1 Tax=Litorimonas sp. TaxID=1892381 RepID=UPI003A83E580
MPKIHNTSILGIGVATIAFYILGGLWYGVFFAEPWMELAGMTEAEALARNDALGPMMFVYGLLITLAQVIGLNWLIHWAGAARWRKCLEVCLVTAGFISFPIMLYSWLYEGTSFRGDILDLGHIAVGYGMALSVLFLRRFAEKTKPHLATEISV